MSTVEEPDNATERPPATVRHRGWADAAMDAGMPTPAEAWGGLAVTDRAIRREDIGWIPISGELHYSRLPRHRWSERLRQLRAAGITVASTYVFWSHHVPRPGAPRFDGRYDVGGFIDDCAAAGLYLVLRIGPWAHGEARNGGFPDWVQEQDVRHRTDDPRYLALVQEWFGQLGRALDGRIGPGGPVIAIQLENELYDQPDHLLTLKRLAREAGIAAPLWTATAWGGAALPPGEAFPVFSGYADGFWQDPAAPWDATFRAHFLPSHDWDDPGVGADVRTALGGRPNPGAPAFLQGFPPATCELGSGMATAYHRRPVLAPADIAALAHTKIGNGSAWQGYYMFAGGRNPAPGMQETQATGYPNDLPSLSYDFHAPIGQSGDLNPSASLLRAQHAFLNAFGDRLSGMASTLPDRRPRGIDDRTTLRWALRSDGKEGFAMISHHQPYLGLDTATGVRLAITQDESSVVLPSCPVDVPSGTLARWPVGLRIGGALVRGATASALTLLPGSTPTLVLVADTGIPVEIALDEETPITVEPSSAPLRATDADILILPAEDADRLWVQERAGGGRRLLRTDAELSWDDHRLYLRSPEGADDLERYDPTTRRWSPIPLVPPSAPAQQEPVRTPLTRAASAVPADHGFRERRHRAPDDALFARAAAVFTLELPDWARSTEHDAVLDIDWEGDVAQLRVDDIPVDDRFWDGTRWRVSLRDADVSAHSVVTLLVLPLSPRSTISLGEAASARHRLAGDRGLCRVTSITARSRGRWRAALEEA
jgi:hypothetical protein